MSAGRGRSRGRARGAPDPTLLERCRGGDQDAWREFVGLYERLVYSVPRSYGLGTEDAADITQATFASFLAGLRSLRDEDVIVVASAGNDGRTRPQWPAAYDDVLAVASVSLADRPSSFTNRGSWIDVAAPGEGVVSAFPRAVYARWDGTSMAAPFVAGQAALLRAQRPDADEEDVAVRIRGTAVPVGTQMGAGRIDLAASLWVP